jgi:hypothetical protein
MKPDVSDRSALAQAEVVYGWEHPSAAGRARHHRELLAEIVKDGALAGVLGSAVIAALLAASSLLAGRSAFHIAAILGSTMFGQSAAAGATAPVLAYTAAHTAALILIGVMLAGLARLAASTLQGWYVAALGLLFVAAHIVALPIWFGDEVSAVLPLWRVAAATGVGILAMCIFLWWRIPEIAAAMHEPDE